MRVRPGPWWPALLFLAGPTAAPAAPPPPTVVARVQSLEALLEDFQHLATVAGQEEVGKQAAGFFQALGGPQGAVGGIDVRRPFGFYAALAEVPTESPAVLLVPVADEDA